MLPEHSFLDELADSVADGREIDWSKAEASARTPRERSLVAQLRLLARVGSFRALDSPGFEEDTAIHAESPREKPPRDGDLETATRVSWRHLEVATEIGRGSFGTVYRAWDANLRRDVALKLVDVQPDEFAGESVLLNEARLLARVRHPNVVAIYGADRSSGKIGLWMEFVHGRTLREIVSERGPFSPREAIGICLELSRALAAVHAAGLVHRDVKAQNIMREQGGRIVLMDFGAGEELGEQSPGGVRGTPIYMAPELVNGEPATPRSDVYSLGVLLFYLVTGTHPVNSNLVEEVQSAHRGGQRKLLRDLRPDAPPAFVQCVEQLIEPDPARRVQTAGAAEAVLLRALEGNRRTVPMWAAGVAAAIAAVVLLGIGFATLRTRWAAAPAVQSLAVLPMVNLSGDPLKEYVVDGMTDLLIAELSRISSLRVTSRTSIMGYKQTSKRIDDIARELNVDTVLEASLMLSDSQLRLNASLIRASDQVRLWGQTYERPLQDAFALQATMAKDLADAVRLALTPEERRHLQNPYVGSQEAQDLYLRGRFVFHLLDRNRTREACTLFEQAVKLDPRFAVAWASLARCYAYLGDYGAVPLDTARSMVVNAASRAIAEDDGVVEAHVELAQVRFLYDWDWRTARDGFEQAIRLDSNNSLARDRYARFLAAAGLTSEAIDQARRGVQIDPQSAEMRRTLALVLYYGRQYAEALQQSDEAVARDPTFVSALVVRAQTLAALQRYDEATQSMQVAAAADSQPSHLAEIAQNHARSGRTKEALAILAQMAIAKGSDGVALTDPVRSVRRTPPPPGRSEVEDAAFILAALGRQDEALDRLEQAIAARSPRLLWLRVDPRVDSLRQNPRFAALLTRIGGLD